MRAVWALLAALVAAQIGYPLTAAGARAGLVVATVLLGFAASLAHAHLTRGVRAAGAVLGVAAAGLLIEILGIHTGVPFGSYSYAGTLGPQLAGVPVVIGLAWAWMAWPAWLAAGVVTVVSTKRPRSVPNARRPPVRPAVWHVSVAAVALAAWDLFLDPQLVRDGHWRWHNPHPALPGVPGVPLSNYVGWLLIALLVATLLQATLPPAARTPRPAQDAPMFALYLWTFASSVLAHAAFLSSPASAAWGALGMGAIALPLAARLRAGAAS